MGKIKRTRQTVHSAAVRVSGRGRNSAQNGEEQMEQDKVLQDAGVQDLQSNLFEGLDLSKYSLKTQLPELDAQSAVTSRSLKGLKLKKKEKQKLRHDLWLQKLSAIDSAKKRAKDKKKKQRTPVVGDIGSLGDALPTLELLLKTTTNPPLNSEDLKKSKAIQKEKRRKKQMMDDIAVFQKVIKHPSFKENPTGTIAEHLQNRQKQEDMEW